MAIARPGPLFQAISGSIGSVTVASTGARTVVRPRPLKTRSTSPKQLLRQSAYNTLLAGWRAMTDAQRQGWRAAAASTSWPTPLGTPSSLTGWNLYFHVAWHAFSAGQPLPTAPPAGGSPGQPTVSASSSSVPYDLELTVTPPDASWTGYVFPFIRVLTPSYPSPAYVHLRFLEAAVYAAGSPTLYEFNDFDLPKPQSGQWVQAGVRLWAPGQYPGPMTTDSYQRV